ncbi:MAG: sulfite exporter TauE/SafE family protein [Candidatus Tectomicrobia bacterium]|uniref:Sulfite exporter TauE/SafE family protein n=1 Tax=Tectimicrobiota bacterium TaxID=2528274 RepID=A0A933LR25_UNCTE|nr:sulfite exporter TauE/SafE family protein [Candidatus Tectomicrobia bacterium]
MLHTDYLYILMFVSGLLGSFGHCIGMCGPVVAAYSVNLKRGSYGPHLLYNLGRITTYSVLGGLMGLTGSFVGIMKAMEDFQNITMVLIGLVMIMMGFSMTGWGSLAARLEGFTRLHHLITRVVKFIAEERTSATCFPMGIGLGFMPCGLLYTAFIAAAGAGVDAGNQIEGFLRGTLMLFLFGFGTMPSLFLLGQLVSAKGAWIRGQLYKASTIMLILAGLIFLYRGLT